MYHSRGKIRFLCKEGKEYKEKVAKIANNTSKPTDFDSKSKKIVMKIDYYFGDLRRRDCSNYDKGILDSLSKILYDDDSQIKRLTLEKFIDKVNPRVEVTLDILK